MSLEARRDVFQAIADPVRRDIISLLANKPMTVNSIVENFKISRPAVSQQLKILNECGIIEIEKKGRESYCKIVPANLIPVSEWIDQYRKLWNEKLDSFENYLIKLKDKKNE